MSPRLLRFYRATSYVVGNAPPLRIGQRVAGAHASGVLLTAANPLSRKRPDGWNARMNARLAERARHLPLLPARGSHRDWHEDGYLVEAPLARVAVLARLFRQNAVVAVRRGRAARLVVLR